MDRMSGCVHISVDPENKSLIYLYFADDAAQTNCMRLLRDNKKYGTCCLVRVEFCPPYLCMIAISQIGTESALFISIIRLLSVSSKKQKSITNWTAESHDVVYYKFQLFVV